MGLFSQIINAFAGDPEPFGWEEEEEELDPRIMQACDRAEREFNYVRDADPASLKSWIDRVDAGADYRKLSATFIQLPWSKAWGVCVPGDHKGDFVAKVTTKHGRKHDVEVQAAFPFQCPDGTDMTVCVKVEEWEDE